MKFYRKKSALTDPLSPAVLKGPGFLESMLGVLLGEDRVFDALQIEVTSFCPASCSYCPHTTMKDRWLNRHMTPETFAALWPLLRRAKRVHLQGWGEPLLHPRFMDFAAVAGRAGCRVSTTTCGLIMNDELAERLVRSGVDVVAFSLAGTDAASNAPRCGVAFDRVRESVACLQKARKKLGGAHLEIHIAYLLLASQLQALHALPEVLEEFEARAAVVSTLDFIATPELAAEAFMPHETEKISRAHGILREAAARAGQRGKRVFYALPAAEPRGGCLENIDRSMYIDAEGRISPCVYVNLPVRDSGAPADGLRRVFGQAGIDDPAEVWSGPEYRAFRSGLLEGRPDENCRECPKRFAVEPE